MDRFSRLQALSGDKNVAIRQERPVQRSGVYEGTDSEAEEEEEIVQRNGSGPSKNVAPSYNSSTRGNVQQLDGPSSNFGRYSLQFGELAPEGESFCPFTTIKKYPYNFVGQGNRKRVAEGFFDRGKIYEFSWHFFYLYRLPSEGIQPPIILVPTKEVELLFANINKRLKINLAIPSGSKGAFEVTFGKDDDGTPKPRYLGYSKTQDMAERLRNNPPPHYFRLDGEPGVIGTPSDRSLAAFQAKIALMLESQKGKKNANKEKQKTDRIEKQKAWRDSTKRVQRYLGLRQTQRAIFEPIRNALSSSGLEEPDFIESAARAAAAKLPPRVQYHPEKPAPYDTDGSVIFVCVDVEAYERAPKVITEIGIATLDTHDLKGVPPGVKGDNWMKLIRARHFRIQEYKHLNNSEFVMGCADRFEFGKSEFIKLKDAPQIVASCFKHPFSQPGVADEESPKRNIILTGHDVGADINYLKMVGYDVTNLSNLQETADTAVMWRYLKRETNPRNLGAILAELGLVGWNLHNAGNDAVYTLQAMIGIALKHLDERQKSRDAKEKEKKARISESLAEAMNDAIDREQGWSSSGENSDGGAPVPYISKGKAPNTSNSQNRTHANGLQGKSTVAPAPRKLYESNTWDNAVWPDLGGNSQPTHTQGGGSNNVAYGWGNTAAQSSNSQRGLAASNTDTSDLDAQLANLSMTGGTPQQPNRGNGRGGNRGSSRGVRGGTRSLGNTPTSGNPRRSTQEGSFW